VIKATEIRRGLVLKMDDALVLVTDFMHTTPGNLRGIIQIKGKDLMSGAQSQKRLRPSDTVEVAYLDKKEMQYLYQEGDHYVFMDNESYEQITIPGDVLESTIPYIAHNSNVTVTIYEGNPIAVDLPTSVVLAVSETEPGARGNSVTNIYKPAKLETGLEVKVPLHINKGDRVKVDTRTGEFLERVNT